MQICKTFLGTKRKGNIIRHLDEKHFFPKTKCIYCRGEFLRIEEHLKRCKVLMRKNLPQDNNTIYKDYNKNEANEIKLNCSTIITDYCAINKHLLKEKNKISFENIYFYKNKEIGSGSFCNVFLGSCTNFDEILAIKIIKSDDEKELTNLYLEEKNHLISLTNKGNFPILFDWNYDGKCVYLAESLMGPSLKEMIKICPN